MIHILDYDTINKIAAGEVVERPASAIKELMENSIDAKATAITVEIKDGGKSLIRVTDNGCGIESSDVKTAFLRHTTSKITNAEDLRSTRTLGFRGEALSSISAVAEVEMLTKRRSDLNGSRYHIAGGIEKAFEEVGCPDGTTIIIRDIFFNTPARKKFMKSDMTEAGYIGELMERMALSHPEIAFKFINQNRTILQTAGNDKLKDVIYAVFGRDAAAALLEVNYTSEDISISGYIGKSAIARGNRNMENYFINGRYIKNNIVNKAIEDAYSPYMMKHKYPFTAIHLSIPTEMIDVNVHPSKLEVRFENGERVYTVINTVIAETLAGKNLIPKADGLDVKTLSSVRSAEPIKPTPESFEKRRINETKPQYEVHDKKAEYKTQPAANPLPEQVQKAISEVLKEPVMAKNEPVTKISENMTEAPANRPLDEAAQRMKPETVGELKSEPAAKPEQLSIFYEDKCEFIEKHRIIGQVFLTYWLVEIDNMLYIIDQHAAHEKVLYEQICERVEKNEHLMQQLSPPMIVRLSLKEEAVLKENMPRLEALGFEISHFGGSEYSISGVPTDMPGLKENDALQSFLALMAEENSARLTPEDVNMRLATIACKAAVKGNNKMSAAEAETLIDTLLTLKNPFHCPHGRPVIISMSKSELERKFKR